LSERIRSISTGKAEKAEEESVPLAS
jgi:hypothetical protein